MPALQKLCDALPVGAAVVVTVNVAVDDVAVNAGLHCDTTHEYVLPFIAPDGLFTVSVAEVAPTYVALSPRGEPFSSHW